MNYDKEICDLEWCKKHQQCIFKNAESSIKVSAYESKLGTEINADIILCYQKKVGLEYLKPIESVNAPIIRKLENHNKEWKGRTDLCENPKCKLGNPPRADRYNDQINLCQSCNDLIHSHKTQHELAKYFSTKHKIVKLLDCIWILEKESNDKPTEVIRCSNIYCGTTVNLTRHHLIPKPYRRTLCTPTDKIPLCRTCHGVHQLKTNRQLAKNYNTKEAIIELLSNDREFRITRFIGSANEEYQSMMA